MTQRLVSRFIKKAQNLSIDNVGFLNWHGMGSAGDDGLVTAWNGFGQLVRVLALNQIVFASHDESRRLDMAEIVLRILRLRPPHRNDVAVKIGPLIRVWCKKPVTKGD